jgi:putative transposase
MPHHYSEINLHVVWHTKENLPLITHDVEPIIYGAVRNKLRSLTGAFFHEIGGIENHVHVCFTVPPTILVSKLIGQLKGASSYAVNHQPEVTHKRLEWQDGYGVVSFGTGDLEWVRRYIRDQKNHHARGTTHDRLERTTPHSEAG